MNGCRPDITTNAPSVACVKREEHEERSRSCQFSPPALMPIDVDRGRENRGHDDERADAVREVDGNRR